MTNHWQLLHVTKRTVTALAWAGAGMSTLTALGALLELVLNLCGQEALAYHCGVTGEVACVVLTAICGLLMPWCHDVLMGGRGLAETRLLVWLGFACSVLMLATTTLSLATGLLIHPLQADLPAIVSAILLATLLLNIPNMAAARPANIVRIILLPALLLTAYVTNDPALFLANDIVKLILGYAGFVILQAIAQTAPYIATMPPRH